MVKHQNGSIGAANGRGRTLFSNSAYSSLLAVTCSCLLLLLLLTEATASATTKIIGGTTVTNPTKYPYFVEWKDARCGASLIHDDIAISAAHCENLERPFDARVYMLGVQTGTGIERTVETQVAHPLYDGEFQAYDYLILKLHTSALVDDAGNPTGASIMAINKDPAVPAVGDTLLAMGYGKLDQNNQDISTTFQEVQIQYVSDEACAEQYASDFVQELMFCSGVPGGGKDTCQGDSGGPIIHVATGLQVGAVSYGIGCGQADYSGVNSRLSAAWEWIEDQICKLSDNPPARCGTATSTHELPVGTGLMSIRITHDDYPDELAWSLTYLGPTPASGEGPTNVNPLGSSGGPEDGYTTQIEVFFRPFGRKDIADRSTVSEAFSNLPPGRYSAQFGDLAGDGMCCAYGNGKLEILDGAGVVVWENGGNFENYIEAVFDLDASDGIIIVEEDLDYENSWESFKAFNHPPTFDQEWPGAMPVAATGSLVVNVKFDGAPAETAWQFYSDAGGNWDLIQSFDGSVNGVVGDLVSVEVDSLSSGWYKFAITDKASNGICCQNHRRGWVSLTGPLITTQESGLVWGNNGEFGAEMEVYVYVDDQGFTSQVSYENPLISSTTRTGVRGKKEEGNRRQRHLTGSFTDLPKQQLTSLKTR